MLLGVALVLLLLGTAGPASAHAALRATDPEDGTVLKRAPRHLTLTFTESVGLLDDSFRVYGPDRRRVDTGEPGHADGRSDTARAALPGRLGTGTYTVAWRVVSADSHPVSGAFTFSVGAPSPTPAAPPAATEHPLTAGLHAAARYLAYLAAALLIGTAAFAALCRPPELAPLRAPSLTGWWTLLATTVALLLLRAPYESGAGPAAGLDPTALGRTLTSRPGLALLARLALLALCGVLYVRLSRSRDRDSRTPAVLAAGTSLAVALALTWAAAEHASAGIQVPVAMTSSVLHLLAMATWLGGLAALLTSLYRSTLPLPPATVTRFSRLALTSVTVLAATGTYQSWRGLGTWSALTDTSYGRLLIGKVTLVALLLAAAAFSRRRSTRLAATGAGVATSTPVTRSTTTATTAGAAVRERVPQTTGGPTLPPEPEPEPEPGPEPWPGPEVKQDSRANGDPEVKRALGQESVRDPRAEQHPEERASGSRDDAQRRGLRRSVLTEAAVGALVLLLTAALTGTVPGRAVAEAAEAAPVGGLPTASVTSVPFDVGTAGGGRGTVQITLDPGRVGENRVEAVVLARDGGPATVPEVRLTFTLAARDVGPLDAGLTDRGGYWGTNTLTLPLPGVWTMRATIRVSDLDQVTVSRRIRIED
ncbi:copper resistance protein CopC [Streptomyces sp. DH24]|uniref:copper resistance CopC/CopD family protein n=1 Tax=Streptomyces sp. DH24 TaxID=3040123 RepID=UPI0024417FDD|nr:copper resistance protein CopC [Streptomyces sp. DH24]MDG9720640.1 copper resistance protein CopC [Streptomyces sp. DH24]